MKFHCLIERSKGCENRRATCAGSASIVAVSIGWHEDNCRMSAVELYWEDIIISSYSISSAHHATICCLPALSKAPLPIHAEFWNKRIPPILVLEDTLPEDQQSAGSRKPDLILGTSPYTISTSNRLVTGTCRRPRTLSTKRIASGGCQPAAQT
jgi:hypothetical protein